MHFIILIQALELAGVTAVEITCGNAHNCVISHEGKILCWGSNGKGQLGTGSIEDASLPQEVHLEAGLLEIGNRAQTSILSI
jgi:alpha-tubulin suppressor-like RCC1 family protein